MNNNDPLNDWIDKKEKPKTDENDHCEIFYLKYYKPRIAKGWEPDSASRDAPEGFHEWLKSFNRIK